MKSKTTLSLIVCMILMDGNLSHVHAVTDAELKALEKQLEQQEAEEKNRPKPKKKRKLR